MNINKAQLKQLIEAVIREAEEKEKEKKYPSGHGPIEKDPSKLAYPKGQFPPVKQSQGPEPEGETDPDVMKYSRELEQKLKAMKGTKIELYVKHGVKKGKQEFRTLLQKMAQDARQKDFEVIMGQVKKGDKVIDIAAAKNLTSGGIQLPSAGEIDPEDEKAANVAAYQQAGVNVKTPSAAGGPEAKPEPTGRMTIGKMIDIINELPDEEKKLEFFEKLTKSERKAVMNKLAGMGKEGEATRLTLTRTLPLDTLRPGQKEPSAIAWNKMGDEEEAQRSANAKERKEIEAKVQAKWGLPDEKFALIDPIKYLPDKYWTDKEWDRFTQGGETQTATAGAGTKHAGKDVYRPSFSSKKVDPALLKKLAIGTLRENKKRK